MRESVSSPRLHCPSVLLVALGLLLPMTILAGEKAVPPVQTTNADLDTPAGPDWVDEEITVTATLTPRRVADTPVSVDIVTVQEIERQQASDSVDLVQYLPGVYVDQDGSRLGSNGFNIRGIGGNRVLTLIDGIPNAEQFDFGPLKIHQYGVDLGMLARVEVVRSAGSALYGSDALGGVVSLVTKGPDDYLALVDDDAYVGGALGYDGRSDETRLRGAFAAKRDSFGFSIFAATWQGDARNNQGRSDSLDASRTSPNPQGRVGGQLLGKLVWSRSPKSSTQLTVEGFDSSSETNVISGRTVQSLGPMFGPGITYDIVTDAFDADDQQSRIRLSLSQSRQSSTGDGWIDRIDWRIFSVRDRTQQDTVEIRTTTIGGGFFGPLI
ncbi:MAG: TonB-dependent receptor plug domain-containing protein, partial [Thermoanaerobaculia bacterium]|nr:TonB-dependent receptor plug domain-containing protein [Thermoanaerobaculia bacterium]